MFIAQVFDHELGHALKNKCSNGISIYHDNRNLLYEKLSKTTHISTVTIKDDKEETKEKIEDNVEE